MSQSAFALNDPIEQLRIAMVLDKKTPTIRVILEVPMSVHEKLKGNGLVYSLYGFYQSAVFGAIRSWADLTYDTDGPDRLAVYKALDDLMLARGVEAWVKSCHNYALFIEDMEKEGKHPDLVTWARSRGLKEEEYFSSASRADSA